MGKYKAYTPEPQGPVEIDGIPTAEGLVAMGPEFATRRDGRIVITDKGHAVLTAASRRRAEETKGDWHGVGGRFPVPPEQPGYREAERHTGTQRGRGRT